MKVILVSNNLYENNLIYPDKEKLDEKRMTRPLSVEGEILAKKISLLEILQDASLIYSSSFSSALATSKYLSERIDKNVYVDSNLNDELIGILNNKSLSMVKFMQNHDFDIKLTEGESLHEVGKRLEKVLNKIVYLNVNNKVVIFTHKRAILGLLLNYAKPDYNLDDELILTFNDEIVYEENNDDFNIVELEFKNKEICDIKNISYQEDL